MEEVKLPIHKHPLLLITRFSSDWCSGCGDRPIYGGYRCNELGCEAVFHRECVESLPEINHSSHPDHPLKLLLSDKSKALCCHCRSKFRNGYICSVCDFKLDLRCALILENSNLQEHREANHISHPQHPLKPLALEAAPDYADEDCLLCRNNLYLCSVQLHHCDVCNFSICRMCLESPPPVVVESPTTHEHLLHLVPRRIKFTCNACGTLGDRSPYFCLQCNFMIHRECIDLPRVININRHDHRISYTRRLGHGEWKCKVCRKKVDGFYGAYTCVKCPSLAFHSLCATRGDVWDMIELEGMSEEEEETAPFEVIDEKTIKHFSHDHNLLRINNNGHENIVCEACLLQILSEPFYSCKQCSFILHEKCANHPRKKRHFINNLPFTLLTDSIHEVDRCWLCKHSFTGFRYKSGLDVIIDVRCAATSDALEHGSHQHPLYYGRESYSRHCNGCGSILLNFYHCDDCDYNLCGDCAHLPKKVMKNRYDDHPLFLFFGEKNVDGDYWCEACETNVEPDEWFYTCNDCGTILHISCVMGDFSYIMPGSHLRGSEEEEVSNTSDEEEVSETSDKEMVSSNTSDEEVVSSNTSGKEVVSSKTSDEEVVSSNTMDKEVVSSNTSDKEVVSSNTSDDEVVSSNTSDEEVVSNTLDKEVVSNISICRPLCSECNSRCRLPSILKTSKAGVYEYFCSSECNKLFDYR